MASDGILVGSGNGSRERLAWGFLLASFVFWLGLVIAAPVLITTTLQNARRPLVLAVQANGGTVGLEEGNGMRSAILSNEQPQKVEGAANILTSTTDSALVSVYTPDEEQLLARLEVYNNTTLEVTTAEAPRFDMSDNEHDLQLNLRAGRLRLNIPAREGRAMVVRITTPQEGELLLREMGQYSVQAGNAKTWVTVHEGTALVRASQNTLALKGDESAYLALEQPPTGPLSSERNLVANGDFDTQLNGWDRLAGYLELPDQSGVSTTIVADDGEQVLQFERVGLGHADAGVLQSVDQDVTGFEALQVYVTMRIADQSLGVCGMQGSECPLFVRVAYVDMYGVNRVWQQGFYAVGNVVSGATPGVCEFCAPPINPHQQVPLNQVFFYESENLIEKLAQQNIAPRRIDSVSLVASGHSFKTQVFDVALVAKE